MHLDHNAKKVLNFIYNVGIIKNVLVLARTY